MENLIFFLGLVIICSCLVYAGWVIGRNVLMDKLFKERKITSDTYLNFRKL